MRIPMRWLQEYVDITVPLDYLAERMTLAGLEVGSVEAIGVAPAASAAALLAPQTWREAAQARPSLIWDRDKIVVGEVIEVRPHPNADRLVLADVLYGKGEPEPCVTGAPNLFPYKGVGRVSLKVAFALEGAELFDGHQEGFVKSRLKATRIRGVPSRAMVCSEKELGLSDEHEGILFLPDDAPVGVPLADYLGDVVLDIDLTANLARCLSVIGTAREVAALTGTSLRYPDTTWHTEGPDASALARVEIEDPDLCSRYIATIIRDVEIGPSPFWMRERLRRAGMRPINNVVDVTNYVMLEWGQPLHAFDYDKLLARSAGPIPTIIVRRARAGESMTTLDGVHRSLEEGTLLICDTKGPIAVAGVMGGLETEIDEHTRNILLESANFQMFSIRRTSQALKLPSEASLRFGRGIHPSLAEPAARRASELMRVVAGGKIAHGMVDAYPCPPEPVTIELSTADVERTLGIGLSIAEIDSFLRRLGFTCEPRDEQQVRVTVPDHRLDCQHQADLIEELARLYGYDRIPVTDMADRLPPLRPARRPLLIEAIRDLMTGCGLQEVVTYSLTSPAREAALRGDELAHTGAESTYVTLTNPLSPERTVLRRQLLTTVLEVASSNLRFRPSVRFFEVGKVFLPRADRDLPDEPLRLAVVMSGVRHERHWLETSGPDLDFFDLKGVLEALLAHLHVADVSFEASEHPSFQPGRTALLRVAGLEMGMLGELRHSVRDACQLPPRRVAAAELDLDALLAQIPASVLVQPISAYPPVLQDLAVVVQEDVPASRVQTLIAQAGGFLLKSVQLFDVYRGAPIPEGKKSLAFGLAFQAPDKTLRDDQVAKQVERIVARLAKEVGAELRA